VSRYHPENRGPDDEPVGFDAVAEAERRAQGGGVARRQAVERAERGLKQLVQAGKGDVGLELDAPRGQHVHAAGAGDRVLDQRRLADPRVAANQEARAAAQPG